MHGFFHGPLLLWDRLATCMFFADVKVYLITIGHGENYAIGI